MKHPLVIFSFLFLHSAVFSVNKIRDDRVCHGVIFHEAGKYGGWPANHGIWSWGDEVLVGFIQADHKELSGLHTYDKATARSKYARSKDGGITWVIEDAFERGQTARGADHMVPEEVATQPRSLTEPAGDFTNPDFIFAFLRHNNNNGPSHFYFSNDRGEKWEGPFAFPDLGTSGVATRTDYLIQGPREMGAFLTVAKSNGKEGSVVYAVTEDGGVNWNIKSRLGTEHGGFDIMPSSVRLSDTEIITTVRTRTEEGHDLITAYGSSDNGGSWERLNDPVADTGRGGSPPALIQLSDGRLLLGYIYRSEFGSRVHARVSSDNGRTWSDERMLRGGDGANRDAGYPRLVERPDGKVVMIYYWNHANQEGANPYRYIAYTLFDPALLFE